MVPSAKRVVVAADPVEALKGVSVNQNNGKPLMYIDGGKQMILASGAAPPLPTFVRLQRIP